jgi:hypothetical protein
MRIILAFSLLLPFFQAFAQPASGTTDPSKDYYLYEQEEVAPYREIITFSAPEVVEVTEPEMPEGYISVAPHFEGGNKTFVDGDVRIIQLMNLHREINGNISKVDGYRIQIFQGFDRGAALRAKGRFIAVYRGMSNYLMHIEPTYRVRVGDFLTKSEAELFCRRLRDAGFESAFVVPDEVILPKYKGSAKSSGGSEE